MWCLSINRNTKVSGLHTCVTKTPLYACITQPEEANSHTFAWHPAVDSSNSLQSAKFPVTLALKHFQLKLFNLPMMPPLLGLEAPLLSLSAPLPFPRLHTWPAYLIDMDGTGEKAGLSGDTCLSAFDWWHGLHWECGTSLGRCTLMEREAVGHSLILLAGRAQVDLNLPSVDVPLDSERGDRSQLNASTATLGIVCSICMRAFLPRSLSAEVVPIAGLRTPLLSHTTIRQSLLNVYMSGSRTKALHDLANGLSKLEAAHGAVAMAFGRQLLDIIACLDEQVGLLSDATVLRDWEAHDHGRHGCTRHSASRASKRSNREGHRSKHGHGVVKIGHDATTLLALLLHARRVLAEQHALHVLCFTRLPAHRRDGAIASGKTCISIAGFGVPHHFPLGTRLLEALHAQLGPFGSQPGLSRARMWRFFAAACAPWLQWLRGTVFRGRACDPYKEFTSGSNIAVGSHDEVGDCSSHATALHRRPCLPNFVSACDAVVEEATLAIDFLQVNTLTASTQCHKRSRCLPPERHELESLWLSTRHISARRTEVGLQHPVRGLVTKGHLECSGSAPSLLLRCALATLDSCPLSQ